MKIVIIGNNVAGTFTAQNLRSLNEDIEIEIYTQERYPYYTRIKLPELIPEKVSVEDLIVFNDEWYKSRRINLYLDKKKQYALIQKIKQFILKVIIILYIMINLSLL